MRIRPLAALSVAALSAVLLAGCASSNTPDADSTPTPTASSSDCGLDPKSGADSDAITVSGSAPSLTATAPTDLAFTELQRTTASKGDGDDLATGQLVSGQYLVLDPTTGEVAMDSATTSPDDSGLVPIIVDPSSIFGTGVLCTPLGSSTSLTIPGSMLSQGASNVVVVMQSVDQLPTTATGADQDPVAGMPEVELDSDGKPSVTIPDADPPTEVQLADLKLGDGPTVQSGDQVFVQYMGIKWSDGSEFDSSWSKGVPASFQTTGVVQGFQQALEGQNVGSQVLVVIPPAAGYGEGEINDSDLKGETLVFVIDILGVQHTPQQ
ncbi:FKBP-type peptidyl-prolyl cis-trans isomerase [Microbacterium kyungheense]|uniref:peptidylprolyl isomerase n=1 Tax=Microbacterium kyungheense TaxID=1263636 RepID=A0A543FLE4_9MICO|nr:FKBP-type peptidyl-prolyl cis-trans isomerase [Microbacterium kyungheense]TQM34671.1 peptidylprolyl isomerase [Microbacterium kyungheense]